MGVTVALRKESVDRNIEFGKLLHPSRTSLSARRAWIEMLKIGLMLVVSLVALRKESVDRNACIKEVLPWALQSLSARRAWIEIACQKKIGRLLVGRSPQGERG